MKRIGIDLVRTSRIKKFVVATTTATLSLDTSFIIELLAQASPSFYVVLNQELLNELEHELLGSDLSLSILTCTDKINYLETMISQTDLL